LFAAKQSLMAPCDAMCMNMTHLSCKMVMMSRLSCKNGKGSVKTSSILRNCGDSWLTTWLTTWWYN
jgi:hypothetical protein